MAQEAPKHPEPADERNNVHVRGFPRGSGDRVLRVDHVRFGERPEDVQCVSDRRRVVDARDLEGHRAVEAVADLDPEWVMGDDGAADRDVFAEIRVRVLGDLVVARIVVVGWIWADRAVPDEGACEEQDERDKEASS